MQDNWLEIEELFLKINYKSLSMETILKVINKDILAINKKISEFEINNNRKPIPKQKRVRRKEHNDKPPYKYLRLKKILEDELQKGFENNNEVFINIYKLAEKWNVTYVQTKAHLVAMLKDVNFTYKVVKRDKFGIYLFKTKEIGDEYNMPSIQKEPLTNDEKYLKNIPKIKRIKWNSNTDKVVDYLLNKIKENNNQMIKIINKDIASDLNLSESVIKTHTGLINSNDDCPIKKIYRKDKGERFKTNFYKLK